jgi:tetratricopeptide (TPR) repeat protein/predicted Ser/Thr protein kinase
MEPTTENLLLTEAIFHEARAVPDEARNELIKTRCKGNRSLAAEVHSLLEACKAEENEAASCRLESEAGRKFAPESKRAGPYLLDRLLGRGGMGAVYLAHRADGHFELKVAIKLIDLPLASEVFRDRFRQERQILAGLQHPYIARLVDGGVTQDGELYLAMEYVDGVPIHRFCEEQHLSARQQLELFLRVCEAVQFAHQNLVVHRDLKPDNIFIVEDGTPRLLDFGTAKLLSPSLVGQGNEFTRLGLMSFTPQYASPEQVLGNPITTASDTYSLGVLLYLLLAGALPYELKEFTTEEMVRVICNEPPRKVQALSSGKRLDSDLEAILQKALRKEPQQRYLTAERLASDLHAYLEGKPVAARQGTIRYRAAKFIRRHTLGLASAILLATTLAAGIAGVLWQAKVANEERRKSDARSADLRQLSDSLLSELDEAIKQLPGSTGAQKLLITRVLEHLDRMAKDARGDRLTELDLVNAYTQLGNIQGNTYDQNLGDSAGAMTSLDKAIAIAQPLVASNPDDRDVLEALANAQESRSEVEYWNVTEKPQEAIAYMKASAATYDRLAALPNVTPAQLLAVSRAYNTLGDQLWARGSAGLVDLPAAIAAYRKGIDFENRVLRLEPGNVRARRGIGTLQMKIGSVELDTDPAQALKDIEIALQYFDSVPEADRKSLITVRNRAITERKKAMALEELGEHARAIRLFEEVLQIDRQIAAADPNDQRAIYDIGVTLQDTARSYEDAANPLLNSSLEDRRRNLLSAERSLEEFAAVSEQMLRQNSANEDWKVGLAQAQVRIGSLRQDLHLPGESEALSRKGLAVLKDLVEKDPGSEAVLDSALQAILKIEPASLRDPRLAVEWAERGVALSHRKTPKWLLSLAQAYHAAGQIEKARAAAKEGLALLPVLPPGATKPRIRRLLEIESRTELLSS